MTKTYCLTVLEAEIKASAGLVPPKISERECALLYWLLAAGWPSPVFP